MEYQLASERMTRLDTASIGIGRLGPRRMLSVPAGTCHAMPVGGSKAVCGRQGLTLWARPWNSGEVERCEACLELVPVATDTVPGTDADASGEAPAL